MLPAQEWDAFVIRQVDVWNADGVKPRQDVWVEKGVVTKLQPSDPLPPQAPRILAAEGRALIPAGVDLSVQLRLNGDTPRTLRDKIMQAAIRGGVCAFASTPLGVPIVDTPEAVAYCKADARDGESQTGVKVYFTGALTRGLKGTESVDYQALRDAGAVAFSDAPRGVQRPEVMQAALRFSAEMQVPVFQHPEMPGHNGHLAEGVLQRSLRLKAYSDIPEVTVAARDLELLRRSQRARYVLLGVSAQKTLQLLHEAKCDHLPGMAAISAHHLLFHNGQIKEGNFGFKVSPPIRHEDDTHALRQALMDGLADFVVSQHTLHTERATAWDSAPFGTSGLETVLRVLLTLYQDGLLSAERLVQVFSTNAARLLKLDKEYGSIAIGKPLRGVLVDPKAPRQEVRSQDILFTLQNCFAGAKLGGRIHSVFLGRRVYGAPSTAS